MTVMWFDVWMRLPPLSVSDDDRVELEGWVRSRTIDHRDAQRARLVLLAAAGESNRALSNEARVEARRSCSASCEANRTQVI